MDWKTEKISIICEMNRSEVYHERFEYKIRVSREGETLVLLWKNSLLMNNSEQIEYEINVYKLYRRNKLAKDELLLTNENYSLKA